MTLTPTTPKKAINKAYLKERINRADMEQFKTHFKFLLDRIKAVDNESEENRKNNVADFLKSTHYAPQYEINTKGREDLVIHLGKTAKDNVGVLFEIKKPDSSEMMSATKPNAKALQQLVFYYLRERIEHKNLDIKHLIVTDIYNWYIFDENLFDKYIYRNPKFIKGYETFNQSGKDTAFFYNEIAKPLLDGLDMDWTCTHFNLKDYEKHVYGHIGHVSDTSKVSDTSDDTSDKNLIALYKILSPVHLLKLPFANDSNQLDKNFYAELLHIIGLEEVKEGSKKLINRKAKPDEFSLLENTMTKIENKGFSEVPHLSKLGNTRQEQTYNIALELCITWVNRILFLKLLEAQLVSYHKGNIDYRFLNYTKIYDCDRLNKLFFEVLAEKVENRKGKVKTEFEHIPYLNSSLFERTDLERKTVEINYLDDNEPIPLLANTVLKDDKGKKKTGSLPTLQYLFEFLEAYDFASEGTEGIQDDKRTLINASVLGLIFEKINGYKDGSFFTPGFITMYMCRETIRRAVVQKFKDSNLPSFQNLVHFDDLKDAITDRKQANDLINSLKICDPAVGSGHFLVSALNEIMAIKSDLGVLSHRDGSRVKHYKVEVQNDELIVTDEESGDIFQYFINAQGVAPKEVQQLQETLFHEKQTLIENCLFGVDINPNSAKICRLRLWIELLKNAYYKSDTSTTYNSSLITHHSLETLPNIDINIKQGNSLISRFKLNDDLSDVFKKQKFSYKAYRKAVEDYKNTNSKEAKTELLNFITDIKEQFQTVFHSKIKENKELAKFKGQLYNLQNQGDLFGGGVDTIEEDRLEKLVAQYEQKVKDIKDNAIYRDAFEWRFEFPEVLDTEGGYVGFDVVIGNPPYLRVRDEEKNERYFFTEKYEVAENQLDLYHLFIEKSNSLITPKGIVSFIVPNSFLANENCKKLRKFILDNFGIEFITDFRNQVFEDASVEVLIFYFDLNKNRDESKYLEFVDDSFQLKHNFDSTKFRDVHNYNFTVTLDKSSVKIIEKIQNQSEIIETFFDVTTGIKEYQVGKGKPAQTENDVKTRVFNANTRVNEEYLPELRGKNLNNYNFQWNNEYIKYGVWLAEPRQRVFFEGERLLVRQIPSNKSFIAAYINQDFIIDQSIFILKPKIDLKICIKIPLAFLNSKLIYWYFQNINNEFDTLFPKIKSNELKKLPIFNFKSETEQQSFITLVEKILTIKKATPSVSTADLEAEIDKLVYGLYGLTAEEIEIIEKAVK